MEQGRGEISICTALVVTLWICHLRGRPLIHTRNPHPVPQGLEGRLPISIKGKGLGPAAVFSYDVLDVGHTYANTPHQYEVELQNRGKIDVEFK